jgi:serine/threonine-protein kinase
MSLSEDSAPTLLTEQRYEVLREIGRGGMGIVYQARDRRLGRVVALKQLPQRMIEEHPSAVQRFLHEARAAAQLNHPNIVTVYDADREDGIFFITMEMLLGESLQLVLRREGRIPEKKVIQVALQVASGLDYAHYRGIVHRDIKTANLFLTSDNVIKIMDFGLAKILEEVRGASTLLAGTPFYMSPEQVFGQSADPRSDLYSLGVTLYELATARVPFYEGEVAYHHCHTTPVDPRKRVENLSDEFASLILQLLEKDPDARCQSAAEVSERLESMISR